jgi:hypothetical protein
MPPVELKSVDAINGRASISESTIACSECRRHKEGLDTVHTLNFAQHTESGDRAFGPATSLHQHDEKDSKPTSSKPYPCNAEKKSIRQGPWLIPHTAECQKRMWYGSSLGIGTKHVVDVWGFSSTSVSRSQSPDNVTERQDTGNVIDMKN